jgi:hypothetical protein
VVNFTKRSIYASWAVVILHLALQSNGEHEIGAS